jgi:hypothetical protein
MNLSTIHSKIAFIEALLPTSSDALHPQFSTSHIDLFVADVVKHVGIALGDRKLGNQVLQLSKKMGESAGTALLEAWEPGDDLCPPWRTPGPLPPRAEDPTPVPWKKIDSAEQIALAYALTQLSGLTSTPTFNVALKAVATSVARAAAVTLADEFERCGTLPRPGHPPIHMKGATA